MNSVSVPLQSKGVLIIAPDKRCIHKMFFLFLHKNIYCGYSLEVFLMTSTKCVFVEIYKKCQYF